jgi:hypothetical protein
LVGTFRHGHHNYSHAIVASGGVAIDHTGSSSSHIQAVPFGVGIQGSLHIEVEGAAKAVAE